MLRSKERELAADQRRRHLERQLAEEKRATSKFGATEVDYWITERSRFCACFVAPCRPLPIACQ